jgi:hypothetical protein
MLRRQFRETDASEVWADVALDGRFVANQGPRTDACPRDVLQPTCQELRNGLPFIADERALLRGLERVSKRTSDGSPRATVNGLAPALAVLPSKIHTGHPPAIGPLNDAAFSATASASAHFVLLEFFWPLVGHRAR